MTKRTYELPEGIFKGGRDEQELPAGTFCGGREGQELPANLLSEGVGETDSTKLS